jgi:hypothetical protein
VFADKSFKEVREVKWGILTRIRDTRDITHRRKALWESLFMSQKKVINGSQHFGTLILDFLSPEISENAFLLFEIPSLWHFVMENWTDYSQQGISEQKHLYWGNHFAAPDINSRFVLYWCRESFLLAFTSVFKCYRDLKKI